MAFEFQFIGKLNIDFLEAEFGKLATDELILTDERDEHIKERHEKYYKLFHQKLIFTSTISEVLANKKSRQHFCCLLDNAHY